MSAKQLAVNSAVATLLIFSALSPTCFALTESELDSLREELSEFNQLLSIEYYNNAAYGEELDLEPIYQRFYDLIYNDRTFSEISAGLAEGEEGENYRSLLYLYKELCYDRMWEELYELDEEYYNAEATLTVAIDDEDIAYRDIGLVLHLSDDRDFRRRLTDLSQQLTIDHLNPILMEMVKGKTEIARSWGYQHFADLWEYTHETDLYELQSKMEGVADSTEEMFHSLLSERASTLLGMELEELETYDLTILFRTSEYDRYFPSETMITTLKDFLSGIGIYLEEQESISIDDSHRAEKDPRAVTYIVEIPDDIRVLVKPSTGLDDYASLFHETGHAEHYANCTEERYELQIMGDGGVSETYAFLFEDLLSDYRFLTEEFSIPDLEARGIVYCQLFSDLYSLRYYIALLNYELALHTRESGLIKEYKTKMEKYLLVPRDMRSAEASYLVANEDFYGVYYLEAWLLSCILRHYLEEEFGTPWWRNPQSGQFLLSLYAYGEALNSTEIAQLLGYEGLDESHLISYYQHQYKIATAK